VQIAGLTRVEPRVQMSVRIRSSVGVGGNALTSPASTQRKSKPKPPRGRAWQMLGGARQRKTDTLSRV